MITYIAVGEADDETVLGRVVLVLRLGDQPLASIVVGLPLSPSAVLGLVTREVGAGLDELGERLRRNVRAAPSDSIQQFQTYHLEGARVPVDMSG